MYQAYYNSITTINQINNWNFYGDKTIENFKQILNENLYEIKSTKFIHKLNEYYTSYPIDLEVDKNNIYTSHEGLLLNYEECFLRNIEGDYYDLSAHFLWIGERTGSLDEAHVEFFRGVSNPIGIKVSSRNNFDNLIRTINILNPKNEKGKIALITRFGFESAENSLENLCKKMKQSGLNVIFICDPNHGNTKMHLNKKVRHFDELKSEIIITNKVLQNNGFTLSGIHLEASSFHITECLGGLEFQVNEIVDELYTTYCDPRLNMTQTMELCDYIGQIISTEKIEKKEV
jgi:3-deoxy-7-phosphoheptulonate synthase